MQHKTPNDERLLAPKVKILLVDDQPANLLSLHAILDDLGHDLLDAHSGKEALRLMLAEDYALVLLDVQMDGLDGFETAKRIRTQERSRHTPIIFLTAYETDRITLSQAYALGAVDYLVKPLVPVILRAKVDVLVELFQKTEQVKRQADQLRQAERREFEDKLAKENAALRERARLAAFGADVGQALIHRDNLRDMLQSCALAMVGHLNGAFARIWTLNEPQGLLELQASAGLYTHLDGPHSRVPVGKYKIGLIAQEQKAHLTNTVLEDPRVSDREWARQEGMVAFAGYPLVVEDRLVGVMAMFARQSLSDATLEAMASVANAIALGIERKQAQDNLQQQREWLRVTLASVGDAVVATDPEGRVTFLNSVAQTLTGWKLEEAEGRPLENVFNILHEETRQRVESPVSTVIREGVIVGLGNHTVLVARDASERPIADSAAPIKDEQGRILGVVMVFRDVTEERRTEKILRHSEARKTAILQTSLDCIITIDHEGRILDFNPAAEKTFRYQRTEVVGRDIAEIIIPPSLRDQHHSGMARYIATGEGPILNRRIEIMAMRGDGTEFPLELAVTPILTDGPPLFTAYARDISEQKRLERRRNARLAVTQILSEAATVAEAAPRILAAVGERLEWDLGVLWMVDRHANFLRCTEVWHRPGPRIEAFQASWCQRTFSPGIGLPGRVWSSGQPVAIIDVAGDPNFPRAAGAAQAGLHGAFAFPVMVGKEFLGVIEFFSGQTKEADADLLEMVATIGGQVGQFIERREAEEQLRRSEQELADFFENAAMGLHWVGPDGKVLRVNQAELKLLGYTREEYVGHHIAEFHADKDVVDDILCKLAAGETLESYEARLRCKDGSIKYVHINSNVLEEEGRFVHTRCFTYDITDRKLAEERLKESEQRFARFMQHLPGLAWIKDLQGRYVYANDAAEKAFRTPRAELYGKTDEELFPPETAAQFKENDRRALASNSGVQVIEELEREDGILHYSIVSKFPILNPDGKTTLVGGTAIDITDRKRAEEALKEADRLKDEFLAMLAHELRNPLAPIRNALHIIKQPGTNGAMVQQVREMMERQVHHMARLLDDLLDVSRITRGKIDLRAEAVDIGSLVNRTVEAVRPLVADRRHQLTVSLPPDSVRVEADPTRLEQVLTNLLNNSAKYTDPGGHIWLTVQREGDEVVLRVRDTGIGIAPEMLPRIFDLFVQAERRLDRSQGGIGIGLTLVRKLVELHGGKVEAHSPGIGQGSEFVVRLAALTESQLAEETQKEKGLGHSTDLPSRRVLVVDDNVDAAESLAMLLQLEGQNVRVAHDGLSALKVAQAERPDMVLLDIGMPGMDGYEVCRRLRQLPGMEKMLLVALTGWGQEEDRRRSQDAGFDLHFVKPLEPDALHKLLAHAQAPDK